MAISSLLKLLQLFVVFIGVISSLSFQIYTDQAEGIFLEDGPSKGAACLDGSAPLYYYLPGTDSGVTKYYIHFEGGGWCTSYEDCFDRANTDLGSTKQDTQFTDLSDGYFSSNENQNPLMYNWNKIYIRYCDGGSFSGNAYYFNGTNILYFRGKKILEVVLEDLKMNRGFKNSTDVVISGASAGGLSSYLHADYIKESLSNQAKLVVLPDSGFFLDYVGNGKNYHRDMKWVFEAMNCREGVNKKCIEFYRRKGEEWKCFFAQYTVPFVESPIFALQPIYDSWQIDFILGTRNESLVNNYGKIVMETMNKMFLRYEKNSGFVDSCFHHCGYWNQMHINNFTEADTFSLWYNDIKKTAFIDVKDYPCEDCCQ